MSWIFGFLAAGLALAWCFSHQRSAREARRLAQRVGELEAEQARLRGQTEGGEFNLRTILASMAEGVMVVDAQHVLRLETLHSSASSRPRAIRWGRRCSSFCARRRSRK